MIPILATIGISALSTLAGKAAAALIEQRPGGGASGDSTMSSFATILERSQATPSTRALSKGLNALPAPGPGNSRTKDASLGQLMAELTAQRTLTPVSGLIASPQRPNSMQRSAVGRVVRERIGREAAVDGSLIELNGSVRPTIRFRLPTAAASVKLKVQDLDGKTVRTVELGPKPGGLHQLSFDGRGLYPGRYLYSIFASDTIGRPLASVQTASRPTDVV